MSEEKKIPAFVIDQSDTIQWPVSVRLPVDGGEVAEFHFTGEFKRLSESELDKLLGVGEQAKSEEAKEPKRIAQVLEENARLFPQIMVGWSGVRTSSGEDAPFSVESLQSQITGKNGAFISAGLWQAVYQIRHGEARLGN